MDSTISKLGIDQLTFDEKITLIGNIWDSLAEEVEASPLTKVQREEVDRRLRAHQANPEAAVAWEIVETEAFNQVGEMTLTIRFLPEARSEFDEAADWYEVKQTGLGVDFVAKVRQVLDRISATPKMHRQVYADVRKAPVKRFPYIVLYREEADELIVVSIFHTSRDSSIWRNRI